VKKKRFLVAVKLILGSSKNIVKWSKLLFIILSTDLITGLLSPDEPNGCPRYVK
jgi:hypothetical protein